MFRELLAIRGVLLMSLLLTNSVSADKPDTTVQYNKSKAFCFKPLHLNYSPAKDALFCSLNPRANYVHVDGRGKPYCKKPYTLVYESKPSDLYKKTPKCVSPKELKKSNKKPN